MLDDVPLDVLAATFREVRLVDAVHLRPARRQARAYPNVTFVTAEISGAAACFHDGDATITDPLGPLCGDPEVDLVISANVLSQLPILPLDWFGSRGRVPPPDLGRRIVRGHLDGLGRLSARVCLVTDVEQVDKGP
ncbi:hypothetical protein [Methylobacterium sp. BTF04]|uniref:hypothetical protein n=1 Tax=Methylobacterium sp. BTF04 TaxID=2708300 RepID=UPI001FF03502|nr:hypothetical protein [Methylobacterium sp. BTF04]